MKKLVEKFVEGAIERFDWNDNQNDWSAGAICFALGAGINEKVFCDAVSKHLGVGFPCPVYGQQTDFEDDLCDDCGDKWDAYMAECHAFGVNPTKAGFVAAGHDPKIWDHLI